MKHKIFKSIVSILIACIPFSNGLALEVMTHRQINLKIANSMLQGFSLNNYLKSQLGLSQGVGEVVAGQRIDKWVELGGLYEDKPPWTIPYTRSLNHFHDPLKSLSTAGFKGMLSSVVWSQMPKGTQYPGGYYSWADTRDYFYKALTLSSKKDRDKNFAETFRGLGQLMHLVQDASVPAHTRNDSHMSGYHYESAVDKMRADNASVFINAIANPKSFDPSILTLTPNSLAPIPIAKIFDTDKYDGLNASAGINQGLAEYSNANFFSEDTIFDNAYPYPQKSSTDLQSYLDQNKLPEIVIGEDNIPDSSFYIKKERDGETIEHFVKTGYLTKEAVDADITISHLTFILDDVCYKDYASLLIPRAVGYSAGFLNYFFRGDLEATYTVGGLKIKNINTETMSSYVDSSGATIGNIGIYYDDNNNFRRLLASYDLTNQLVSGGEVTIPYTPPSDNSAYGKYIIVFRGKLGNEEGAVIGKVVNLKSIYYVSARNGIEKIYKMATDGSNPTVVYDNQDPNIYVRLPKPSPDGKTLAFVFYSSINDIIGSIYLLDLASGSVSMLTTGDWFDWSPDGKKIVFQRETGQYLPYYADYEIFRIDVATRTETQLTNVSGSSGSVHPAWSPNGTTIAYSRFDPVERGESCKNYNVIYLIDTSGNPIGPVTCTGDNYYDDFAPSWSPDGTKITFIRKKDNELYQLYKLDIYSGAITKLTDSNGTNYDEGSTMSWSPDGSSIAVGSSRDGDYDIWLVNPNGGDYNINLTNSNAEYDIQPSFEK